MAATLEGTNGKVLYIALKTAVPKVSACDNTFIELPLLDAAALIDSREWNHATHNFWCLFGSSSLEQLQH